MTVASTNPNTRERLLEATATLTYLRGVGVGVAELSKAAGVSKRSMYELFESKDEILAASLDERAAELSARLLPPSDAELSPRQRILYVFDQVELHSDDPEYHGCPYLAVQVEIKDIEHPAVRVAAHAKRELQEFFREEARRGGAPDPVLVARQLILVFDGASVRTGIRADLLDGQLLTGMVRALLDTAGVR